MCLNGVNSKLKYLEVKTLIRQYDIICLVKRKKRILFIQYIDRAMIL